MRIVFLSLLLSMSLTGWTKDVLFECPPTDFGPLDKIERYVIEHPGGELGEEVTLIFGGQIKNDHLSGGVVLISGKGPHDLPSFWWGCFFNFFGAGYVLSQTHDFGEFLKGLGGCIVQDATILIVLFSTILK